MIENSIERLDYLCSIIPDLLYKMDNKIFSEKPIPEKWSKKEILGHLIDSATNNHQRFVRGQFEEIPTIIYDQNNWNKYNFYQQIDKNQVIEFWEVYNKQLLELIKRIPSENLLKECKTNEINNYTIEFLIIDYVEHLEYHLKQIVNY